jgi:hypothetical protein
LKDTVPHLPPVEGEPIPAWDLDRLVPRNCIVCRDPKHTPVCVRPDGLLVAQCLACGALFLPQVPGADDLEAFYRSYSLTKPCLQPQPAGRPPFLVRARVGLVGIARAVLRKIGAWQYVQCLRPIHVSDTCEILQRTGGLEGKTVVELGPGPSGGFLPDARRWGAVAIAVEVDPGATDHVAGMGFEVHSSLASISHPVDIFVASHLFEHLGDPLATLGQMASRSRRGTRLLVQVPNAGQAMSVGPYWIGYRVDLEHLNYFTERSLSMSMVQAGFYPECSWTGSQPVLPSYRGRSGEGTPAGRAQRSQRDLQAVAHADPVPSHGSFALRVLARFEGGSGG